MAHDNDENVLITRYLLGRLEEAELQQLEERIMVDTELFNRVLLAEDEMVEKYVEGELPESDRADFKASFLSTPEGRQQESLTRALHEKALTDLKIVSPAQQGPVPAEKGPIAKDQVAEGPVAKRPVPAAERRLDSGDTVRVWWPRPAVVSYFSWATAAVIVLAVGLGSWRAYLQFRQPQVSKGVASLREAYRDQRPTEARISELNYAQPPPTTRGPERDKFDYVALDRAKALIQLEAKEHPSTKSYHDLGRLYLAERDFAKAIDQFDNALTGDPNNAQVHSDYGAALLEIGKASQLRGEAGKSFEEFAKSNEHLSRALELDGSLLEALFNRALCHEYMRLYREAEKDWNEYIEKDPNSGWGDEARKKLRDLKQRPQQSLQDREQLFHDFLDAHRVKDDQRAWKIISESRDSKGSFIESRLVDSYLDLATNGQVDKAAEHLNYLSYAAQLESRHAGDLFMPNLVRFYEYARPSQLESVLRARALMKKGWESFSKYDFEKALETYQEGKTVFESAGDDCEAIYAAFSMGNCYVQQSRAELALSLFQPLARTCEKAQYKHLLAQTLYSTANANQYLRDFSAALRNAGRSKELFEEVGDPPSVVNTRYQLADIYRFVNNPRKALDFYARDLSLPQVVLPGALQQWGNYFSLSRIFDQLDQTQAAIDYQNEALQLAVEAEAPRSICRSYNYLGLLLAKRGDYAAAVRTIERALEIGNALPEQRARIDTMAYSFLQLGCVYAKKGDFARAIENYDQAIRSYEELDSKFFAFTARKEKLLCCMEQSECPSVETEVETLLHLFEEHRTKILEESNRATFFDGEQTIYDVAIEFEHKRGNSHRAFEYSERSRGRSLHDLASTDVKLSDHLDGPDNEFRGVSQPLTSEQIQDRMPEHSQILQYAVLKDTLLMWVVSKGNPPITASQNISNADLHKQIDGFFQMISRASESDMETLSREGMYLYDLLIKPIARSLDPGKQLCIVPDKVLNYLPFAALKSQASGRYFIEERERGLVISASATMFVVCSEYARDKEPARVEKLLSVGAPLFDREAFSGLDDLRRSAAVEAETIASYYGSPRALTGASATKERVMSEMQKADVIHLATHAETDQWDPRRSKLLLARDDSGNKSDGVLQAWEIYKLNVARAKLVVLSACRSGVENYYGGEGMTGLSRPFIAKRIPMVVASLWPVDSDATARLMINFHRYRKRRVNPLPSVEALKQAQIDMLNDRDGAWSLPYYWAPFVVIGGYARF